MTAQEILALNGPALDNAVHVYVMGAKGEPAPYSTDDAVGMKLLDRLPLYVGRIDSKHPELKAERPWQAGILVHEPTVKGDVTRLRVTAPTRLAAICKAALIFVLGGARVDHAPAALARATATPTRAPVQTPAAAAPVEKVPAGRRNGTTATKRKGGKKKIAPAVNKPALHAQSPKSPYRPPVQRPPMPPRTTKFIAPTPIAAAGTDGQ